MILILQNTKKPSAMSSDGTPTKQSLSQSESSTSTLISVRTPGGVADEQRMQDKRRTFRVSK